MRLLGVGKARMMRCKRTFRGVDGRTINQGCLSNILPVLFFLSKKTLFRSISPTSYSNCICNGFLYTYVLVSWREHAYTVASLAHSVGMFWNVLGLIPFPRTVFGDDLWILLGLNLLRRHPKPNLIAHYEKNSSRS